MLGGCFSTQFKELYKKWLNLNGHDYSSLHFSVWLNWIAGGQWSAHSQDLRIKAFFVPQNKKYKLRASHNYNNCNI